VNVDVRIGRDGTVEEGEGEGRDKRVLEYRQ